MAWTLKVDLNGDVRRAPGLEWQEPPTFEAVLQMVAHLFGLSEAEMKTLTLQYRDDESDLCSLTRHTMQDALSLAAPSRMLRLIASRTGPVEQQETVQTSLIAPNSPSAVPEKDDIEGSVQKMDIEGSSSASASATPVKPGLPPFFEAMANGFLNGGLPNNANQPNLFSMLQAHAAVGGRGSCCTPEAAARMIVTHLPIAMQSFPLWSVALEQHAAGNPVPVASMMQTLRDSLEPFPQMAVAQAALESTLQSSTQLEGISAAALTCLETLQALPTDEQTDILAIVLANVMPAAMASAASCGASKAGESTASSQQHTDEAQGQQQEGRHHHRCRQHRPVYTCDGCEALLVMGSRYHCKSCPDYDLCSSCYEQKDWLHPGCEFECHQPSADEDANMTCMDWGFGPWGVGCKGFGKAKAKGFFAGLLAGAAHEPWAPWWHSKCKGKFKGKGKGGFGKGKGKGKHHCAAPEEAAHKAGQASSGGCAVGMEEGEHFAHPWAWWGPPCSPLGHTWWWGSEVPWGHQDGYHCCKLRSEEKRSHDAVDRTEKEARREEKRQHRQSWKEAKHELKEQWKREEKERKVQMKAMKQAAKNKADEAAPAGNSGYDDDSTSSDGTSSSDSWEDCCKLKEACWEDKKQHQKRWKQAKRELKEQLKHEKKELRQQMKAMKLATKTGAGPDAGEEAVCEQFKHLAMEERKQDNDEDAEEVQVLEDATNEHSC